MLKTILASPNSNAIHINRAVNRDCLSAIGRCGPFYVAHCVGNPLPMLKERYTQNFDIHFSRLTDVYGGRRSPPRGVRELTPEEMSGCGSLSLVIPPTEGEWQDLEVFLQDLTGKDRITDPFQKDPRKATRPEDMFFPFQKSKDITPSEDLEKNMPTPVSKWDLKASTSRASGISAMKAKNAPSNTGVGKVRPAKRPRGSTPLSTLRSPSLINPSPNKVANSPREPEELMLWKRKTVSIRALELSEAAGPTQAPSASNQVLPELISTEIPISTVTMMSTPHVIESAVPLSFSAKEAQLDQAATDAQFATESSATHAASVPNPSKKCELYRILDELVNTASSSTMQEGSVSLVHSSRGNSGKMKFCGLTILSLSRKFEQLECELAKVREEVARANEKCLIAEDAATRALKEQEAHAIQRRNDAALIRELDSNAKELQDEKDKVLNCVQKLSAEINKLQEEKDAISAKYSVVECKRNELQTLLLEKSKVILSLSLSFFYFITKVLPFKT